MDKALEEKEYRFIFLTLTCKNLEGEDDAVDGDLIHTSDDEVRDDVEYIIQGYKWNIGYNQYFRFY